MIFLILLSVNLAEAQRTFSLQDKPILTMDGQAASWKFSPLRLTEDQIKALESLQQAYMSEATLLRRELMSLRFELRHLIRDPNVPSKILLERQRKISDLQAKLETLSLSYQIKARSIFTKEQLEQLPQDCSLGMGTGYGMETSIGRGPRRGSRW